MWKLERVQFHAEESTSLYTAGSELLEPAAPGSCRTCKFKMESDLQNSGPKLDETEEEIHPFISCLVSLNKI